MLTLLTMSSTNTTETKKEMPICANKTVTKKIFLSSSKGNIDFRKIKNKIHHDSFNMTQCKF